MAPFNVAACQMRITLDLQANLSVILSSLEQAAHDGVHVLAFPECALTGYSPVSVAAALPDGGVDLVKPALAQIGEQCRACGVAAVVGTARRVQREDGSSCIENVAVVFERDGTERCSQAKMQLVPTDSFACPGQSLHTFELVEGGGSEAGCSSVVTCACIICHDSRHAELVRLPVLRGARLIFYISFETYHDDGPVPVDEALGTASPQLQPYQAQVVARAVENRVFVVHCNVAGCKKDRVLGSHGCSRVVGPDGIVLAQGGVWERLSPEGGAGEEEEEAGNSAEDVPNGQGRGDPVVAAGVEIVSSTIDVSVATALYAQESVTEPFFLTSWWKAGMEHVTAS